MPNELFNTLGNRHFLTHCAAMPDLPDYDICLRLAAAGVDHPERDLAALRSHASNEEELGAFISRRLKREPLERILSEARFYELSFNLEPGVFKPGFETETTMEYGLMALQKRTGPLRILDLGTGTGCILLTLLRHLPDATGLGVDRNEETVSLARRNAQLLDLGDRAEFKVTDWLDGVEGSFDLVISNPPRIPSQAISHLVREVSLYDPREALDGGMSGLDFYRRTARDFRRVAAPGAVGILQVGSIIAEAALQVFHQAGYRNAQLKRDYKMSPNALIFHPEPEPSPSFRASLIKKLSGFKRLFA